MLLVTDTSAACLRTRTVTVCVNSFPRLPTNRGSSFNKYSCHRISKLVTCIESSLFATMRFHRLNSKPLQQIIKFQLPLLGQ
jgi:hypothetical protein